MTNSICFTFEITVVFLGLMLTFCVYDMAEGTRRAFSSCSLLKSHGGVLSFGRAQMSSRHRRGASRDSVLRFRILSWSYAYM